MKTNIIPILIVAVILIVGWSLFTVIQDLSYSDSGVYDREIMIVKSKQYLPKSSDTNSRKHNYPVYKVPNRAGTSVNNINKSKQVPVSQNFSFEVNSINQGIGVTGGVLGKDRAIVANRRQTENTNVDFRRQNLISPNLSSPFSNNMRVNLDRNLADGSLSSANAIGSGLSSGGGSVIMKAFGGDDEGDDFEMGGGTENESFYNDVPVGDGLLIMLLFALVYAIFKLRKQIQTTI